jgi:hypothetical protein
MDKRLLLITGCQRSGTTLLHLVLDSHPAIHSTDEADYWQSERRIDDYLADAALPANVAFKLPQEACRLADLAASYPSLRVLWCLRDPRDVVASMIALVLKHGAPAPLVWACHPNGAPLEIASAIPVLPDSARARLAPLLERYAAIDATAHDARTREQAIFTGALCWRVKNELLKLYRHQALPLHEIRYEELVTAPRPTLETVLSALGLPWSDDVLRHHQLHNGMLIGGTNAARAIDQTKVGRWRTDFSTDELARIRDVTGELAGELGYSL